jgi:hypothetical protein
MRLKPQKNQPRLPPSAFGLFSFLQEPRRTLRVKPLKSRHQMARMKLPTLAADETPMPPRSQRHALLVQEPRQTMRLKPHHQHRQNLLSWLL